MLPERREARRRLFAIAAEQGGHFTAAQARELGYTYQAQAHHVSAGNWIRLDRGLFRMADWVPDLHDELARWSLWSRGRGVVSHETALGVHGIGEFEPSRVHLTVPRGFAKHDAAVVVHHGELPDSDILDRVGFRVTTPERSLIDVAAKAPDEDQLVRAVDEARAAGLVSLSSLRGRSEAVSVHAALYIERALQRMERQ